MSKKIKIAIMLLVAYLLVFLVGFKSGSTHVRMQKSTELEKIAIAVAPVHVPIYYTVERLDYGNYSRETIDEVYPHSAIIKIFMNEKLRPLLKSRDIKIYDETGERIY